MNVYRLILAVVFFTMSAVANAQNVHGILKVVKGDVQIKAAQTGQTGKARIGAKVFPKDVIITGKDARAKIVMVDNNEINVSPDSQIEIQHYEFDPNAGKKEVLLNVIYGKVRAKVEQKYDGKTSKFNVKTPAAVAGVRGTDFVTSFDMKSKASSIITFHGKVEFGTPGPGGEIRNPVYVTPGTQATSVGGAPPAPPTNVPKEQLNQMDKESNADTAKGPSDSKAGDTAAKEDSKEDKKDDAKKDEDSKEAKKDDAKKEDGDKKEDSKEAKKEDAKKEDSKEAKKDDGAKKDEGTAKKDDGAKKDEGTAKKEDAPAKKEEGTAKKEDAPAKKEETTAKKEDAPAKKDSPSTAKGDAPKGDAPKGDAAKGDAPKGDAPKGDAPKTETAKTDAPKASSPSAGSDSPAPRGPASVSQPATSAGPGPIAGPKLDLAPPPTMGMPSAPMFTPPAVNIAPEIPKSVTDAVNGTIQETKTKLIIRIGN